MKTLKDWHKSRANYFGDYFAPGDIVGKDVVDYFRNETLPVTDWESFLQAGGPQTSVDGRSTYTTFTKEYEGWVYRGNCFKGEKENPFNKWLDTFIEEKGIDTSEEFNSTKKGITQTFSYEDIISNIKNSLEREQEKIKNKIIEIDFNNADVKDFFRHISKALIPEREDVKEMEAIFGESFNIDIEDEEESI